MSVAEAKMEVEAERLHLVEGGRHAPLAAHPDLAAKPNPPSAPVPGQSPVPSPQVPSPIAVHRTHVSLGSPPLAGLLLGASYFPP